MRALAGLGAAVFPPLGSPAPIRAADILDLRSAINEARNALGIGVLTLIDPTLSPGTTPIRANHVQQLRNGVR